MSDICSKCGKPFSVDHGDPEGPVCGRMVFDPVSLGALDTCIRKPRHKGLCSMDPDCKPVRKEDR